LAIHRVTGGSLSTSSGIEQATAWYSSGGEGVAVAVLAVDAEAFEQSQVQDQQRQTT